MYTTYKPTDWTGERDCKSTLTSKDRRNRRVSRKIICFGRGEGGKEGGTLCSISVVRTGMGRVDIGPDPNWVILNLIWFFGLII